MLTHIISILAAFSLFLLFLEKVFQQLQLEWSENSQIFNEEFYLPLLPTELWCTQQSHAAAFWATLYPAELRCTRLSYAAPSWYTLHPTELFGTLMRYTVHFIELRCNLLYVHGYSLALS